MKLKELGTIVTGNTPSKQSVENWDSPDIGFVKPDIISDTGISIIDDAAEYISEKARAKARIVGENSILITCIGSIGKIGITAKGTFAFNQQINAIIPNRKVNSKYLAYALLYAKPRLVAIANAPVVPIINKSQFGDFEIKVTENTEYQSKAVEVLDTVNAIIENRRQQLQKLDELVKARFVEMFGDPEFNTFGWDTEELGTLCDVGSSKRIYQNEQSQEGIPFWRISDLISKMDIGVADSGLFIPEERYVELKNAGLVPTTGDILVTSRGTLGRCYIIKDEDKFYFQDGMISWLSNYVDGITPLYLQYLFTMPGFRKQIDGMQAGSTVAYLSIAMLKKLRVMVPPIETQNCFALFVEQLDKSKVAVQKSLDEAQLLFDSLMQQYFG